METAGTTLLHCVVGNRTMRKSLLFSFLLPVTHLSDYVLYYVELIKYAATEEEGVRSQIVFESLLSGSIQSL